MSFSEETSLYELLEVAPDATPQEIRAAYLRAKTAYKRDSLALYSLMSEEETESLLRKIEQAHSILANPERRKEYDRMHGILGVGAENESQAAHPVVSIDRVPPMERENGEDLLIAPRTDFTAPTGSAGSSSRPASAADELFGAEPDPFGTAPAASSMSASSTPSYSPPPSRRGGHALTDAIRGAAQRTASEQDTETLNREIAAEAEWRGAFLRRVRETRGISLEELSSFTKISKTYLSAIEEENYGKLPAPVYLRGFVAQTAKALRLPQEKVVAAYMARHAASAADGNGSTG